MGLFSKKPTNEKTATFLAEMKSNGYIFNSATDEKTRLRVVDEALNAIDVDEHIEAAIFTAMCGVGFQIIGFNNTFAGCSVLIFTDKRVIQSILSQGKYSIREYDYNNIYITKDSAEIFTKKYDCLCFRYNGENILFGLDMKDHQLSDYDDVCEKLISLSQKNGAEGENLTKNEVIANQEIRKKCNVCGKIFVYTADDLVENIRNANLAQRAAKNSVLSAVAGTAAAISRPSAIGAASVGAYANSAAVDRYSDKIIDYNRCPECGSRDLSDLDDTNSENRTIAINSNSAADELVKFKDLLDKGIITQDEFDAKKKQLLGI